MTLCDRGRLAALGLLLLAGPGLAQAPEASPAPIPRIAVEPGTFDFGKVLPRRTVTKEFRIRNFGTADLVIEKVSASCNCTDTRLESKVVKPGESTSLQVSLDTRDTPGPVEGNVAIRSNDPTQAVVEVKVKAVVTGPKRATPPSRTP